MQMTLERVFNNKFFVIGLIVSFFSPAVISYVPWLNILDVFFNGFAIIITILFLLYFFYRIITKKWKPSMFFLLVILLGIIVFISTILNEGNIVGAVKFGFCAVSSSLCVEYYTGNSNNKFFSVAFYTYAVMFVVHVLIALFFPSGLTDNKVNPMYFLTNDNQTAIVVVLYLTLFNIMTSINNKSKCHYLWYLLPLVSCIVIDSANLKVIVLLFILMAAFEQKIKSKAIGYIIASLICLMLAFILFDTIENNFIFDIIGRITGRDITFTGRIYIWEEAIEIYKTSPLFGIGYGYTEPIYIWDKYYHCHNLYLTMLIYGGILGFAVFGVLILGVVKKIINLNYVKTSVKIRNVILCMLLYFLVESGMSPIYYFFILAIANNSNFIMTKEVINHEFRY